ncbi:hypothetical protein THAOC_23939, partial [Thalassiosira oceanica]
MQGRTTGADSLEVKASSATVEVAVALEPADSEVAVALESDGSEVAVASESASSSPAPPSASLASGGSLKMGGRASPSSISSQYTLSYPPGRSALATSPAPPSVHRTVPSAVRRTQPLTVPPVPG